MSCSVGPCFGSLALEWCRSSSLGPFTQKTWEDFLYCGACVILLNLALRCSLGSSQDIQE